VPVGADNPVLWVPKTCATWARVMQSAVGRSGMRRAGLGPSWRWDDLRLAGLKLVFLMAARAVPLLGLPRRERWWKDAGILTLGHQLAGAGREHPGARPRLPWPDRAWLALLAGTVPAERLAVMRLIVTPGTQRSRPGTTRRARKTHGPGQSPSCMTGTPASPPHSPSSRPLAPGSPAPLSRRRR
jgi:hypothetical protein